ncbi:MAG: hypothetical protein KDD60_11150, partial [Bdellovibrionales bacterium]|nr:hypothetical protein [Bdellovibrionales bacterium]
GGIQKKQILGIVAQHPHTMQEISGINVLSRLVEGLVALEEPISARLFREHREIPRNLWKPISLLVDSSGSTGLTGNNLNLSPPIYYSMDLLEGLRDAFSGISYEEIENVIQEHPVLAECGLLRAWEYAFGVKDQRSQILNTVTESANLPDSLAPAFREFISWAEIRFERNNYYIRLGDFTDDQLERVGRLLCDISMAEIHSALENAGWGPRALKFDRFCEYVKYSEKSKTYIVAKEFVGENPINLQNIFSKFLILESSGLPPDTHQRCRADLIRLSQDLFGAKRCFELVRASLDRLDHYPLPDGPQKLSTLLAGLRENTPESPKENPQSGVSRWITDNTFRVIENVATTIYRHLKGEAALKRAAPEPTSFLSAVLNGEQGDSPGAIARDTQEAVTFCLETERLVRFALRSVALPNEPQNIAYLLAEFGVGQSVSRSLFIEYLSQRFPQFTEEIYRMRSDELSPSEIRALQDSWKLAADGIAAACDNLSEALKQSE